MVASEKSVAKAQEDKKFYKLEVTFDPKMGMQIKQDSNQVGPFDIMGALNVVHGLHLKYFVDEFSKQIKGSGQPELSPEQKKQFDEAMQKTLTEMGLDKDGKPVVKDGV